MSIGAVLVIAGSARAQDMPADYQAVLDTLAAARRLQGRRLKVNVPRSDLNVTIGGRPAPTPFGFGGWIALTKGDRRHEVLMGDLVLTEDEVNPVMSALLDNGLDVTALHNHFFWEEPRIFYMHVHGMGTAADLATRVKPALDLIAEAAKRAAPAPRRRASAGDARYVAALADDRRPPGRADRARLQDHDRPSRPRTCASMGRASTRAWD